MKKERKESTAIAVRNKAKKKKQLRYWLIAVPFVIHLLLFCYLPIVGWCYSFFDYKVGTPFYRFDMMEFVGFEYYIDLFTDREMLRVMRNTLAIKLGGYLLTPLPLIFAIFLNDIKNSKVRKFVQTTTTFPNFISWVLVFGIASMFFSYDGMLNQLLKAIGLEPFQFGLMGEKDYVRPFQVLLAQWKGLGWSSIIYLAAITSIDTELYDAAKVDGACKTQLIRHITIPGVMPTFFVLLLLSIGSLLSVGFEQYYMFMNPLVAEKMEVIDYYVYKLGLLQRDYSYSVAVGIVHSAIGVVLLFTANYLSKKVRGYSLV